MKFDCFWDFLAGKFGVGEATYDLEKYFLEKLRKISMEFNVKSFRA